MHTYTNRFTVSFNQEKTEAVINFFQNVPIFPDQADAPTVAKDLEMENTTVANIVMTGQCALQLANVLLAVYEQEV